MAYGHEPFGLREIKIKVGVAVPIALPAGMTLTIKERVVSSELEGDDVIKAVVSATEAVEWEIEAGGISLAAYAAMTGRTAVTSGTTPSEMTTLGVKGGDVFPYFALYGKALGSGADDIHCKLSRCKITEALEGEFKKGEFFVTKVKGIAVPDTATGTIMEFVQHETATALPTT